MIIGVTGGVGTGKSTVLEILAEEYGAVLVIADDIAKEMMLPGGICYRDVAEQFGPDILLPAEEGELPLIDRAALANIVFADEEKLLALNHITHPRVKEYIIALFERLREDGKRLIVLETAILIQAGYLDLIDELWVVHTDYEVRVKRLQESRGYSPEKTASIINSQLPAEEMEAMADFVIDNSRGLEETRKQIAGRLGNPGE